MVTVLEMMDHPRDKILWELATQGNMKKRDLRRSSGLRLSELEPILEELAREDKIGIDARKMITLKDK
jgi:hypothetical protein